MSGAQGGAAVPLLPPRAALQADRPADRLDALLWLAGLVLLLGFVPVGRVTGDGIGYAFQIAAGTWAWNPNHLFFEPAGALWHRALAALGSTRPVVDQLKLLSLGAGAAGAALFRLSVARRLAAGQADERAAANHATAWLALGATYSHLLVADEFHIVQMPCVVLFAAALLRYLERPSLGRAAAAGGAAAAATLFFASNVLLGLVAAAVLAAVHLARGERGDRKAAFRAAAGLLAGLLLVSAAGLGIGWRLASTRRPIVSWLFTYAGGAVPPRALDAYGVRWTASGVATSAARAVYGAASALVDLEPAVGALRDEGAPGRAAAIGLAWLLGAAALAGGLAQAVARRRRPAAAADRAALLLQLVWWPAVLGFALYWNNSEDQFFLPLAVAFGALAARLSPRSSGRRRTAGALVLCGSIGSIGSFGSFGFGALAWNAADVVHRFVLYPRAASTAVLVEAIDGACLVVVPGWDDAGNLLNLARGPHDDAQRALTEIAVQMPAARGLPRLAADVRRCLAAGRRVDLVDVFDTPPWTPPWKFLRLMGYERGAVEAALGDVGSGTLDRTPRLAGPFHVRSLRAPAAAIPAPPGLRPPGTVE